jgi:hypothetical protein
MLVLEPVQSIMTGGEAEEKRLKVGWRCIRGERRQHLSHVNVSQDEGRTQSLWWEGFPQEWPSWLSMFRIGHADEEHPRMLACLAVISG